MLSAYRRTLRKTNEQRFHHRIRFVDLSFPSVYVDEQQPELFASGLKLDGARRIHFREGRSPALIAL